MANFFNAGDFKKDLKLKDVLVFDKQKFQNIKVELKWVFKNPDKDVEDLDLCAFLVDAENKINDKLDLVYFGSQHRWLTEKPFDDDEFNPLKGEKSDWEGDAEKKFKNDTKWKERTLPLSSDDSVIGSWDDAGGGDCLERMHVLLDEVDTRKYKSIIFAVVVAEKEVAKDKTFSDCKNPVVRIVDVDNNELLAEYKLDQAFSNKCSVCFGKLTLDEKKIWCFETMADAYGGGLYYLATEVF